MTQFTHSTPYDPLTSSLHTTSLAQVPVMHVVVVAHTALSSSKPAFLASLNNARPLLPLAVLPPSHPSRPQCLSEALVT